MTLTVAQLDERLAKLPALPVTVIDVLRLVDQPDVDIATIEKKISLDQGLAARMLKVANSPFYGMSGRIQSVRDACVMLGVHTIRNVVITTGVLECFPPETSNGLDRTLLWRHAIGTGVAAKVLSRLCGQNQETAFTAGLLHDIGKLALEACFPGEYADVFCYRDTSDCLLRDAELAVLGLDHALAGEHLLSMWRLPGQLTEAVARHHRPDEVPGSVLADIVHLADILCRGLEIGDGGDGLMPLLSEQVLDRLGLSWSDIAECLPEIERITAASELM
jgi:putative nucleotidyltransferase with HDIG domain